MAVAAWYYDSRAQRTELEISMENRDGWMWMCAERCEVLSGTGAEINSDKINRIIVFLTKIFENSKISKKFLKILNFWKMLKILSFKK